MPSEVLHYLNPQPGQFIVDCTLGGAGHSIDLARKVGESGKVLAFDLDEWAIEYAEQKIKEANIGNIIIVNDNFVNLAKIIKQLSDRPKEDGIFSKIVGIDGILLDLGLSSAQLNDESRGFSFQGNRELNMSFRKGDSEKTFDFVNRAKEEELSLVFKKYGEEKFARRVAAQIVIDRKKEPIKNTQELVESIKKAIPASVRFGNRRGIHFATKIFQALRIQTNDELESLKKVLPDALDLLNPGGRMVLMSYHSLEDRIVKNFFRDESRGCICPPDFPICNCGHQPKLKIINKKIITATDKELNKNPRARSAKMRVAEKI